MRVRVRFSLLALLAGTIVAVAAPAAAQAALGIEGFVAINCSEGHEECAKGTAINTGPESPTKTQAEAEGYVQAAGHPPFGITDFRVATTGAYPTEKPDEVVTHIRTDVAPGLSTNPDAVPQCTMKEFGETELVPGKGIYGTPACAPSTKLGTNTVLVYDAEAGGDVELHGTVYNLVQPEGRSAEFGVALELGAGIYAHTLIEGYVEYASDYHDYFEINVSPALPLIRSRLVFEGNGGNEGGFLTNGSVCGGGLKSGLILKTAEGGESKATYTTPIGLSGCSSVPFAPTLNLSAGNTQQDESDGITATVGVPHNQNTTALDSSQLKNAVVTLPEGLTLNPSAGKGLEACTEAQFKIHTHTLSNECPKGSEIGTVALNVPDLPAGALTGSIYLASPGGGSITAPPYTIYVEAKSARYGVAVRVKGSVSPNAATGQLTATFSENPEQPFTSIAMTFKGGNQAPLANPLTCGEAKATTALSPFTGTAAKEPTSSFTVYSNNAGGSCSSPIAFAPTQSTPAPAEPLNAGGHTAYTFTLERAQGQQYLSQVYSVLPNGLVGSIPSVPLCSEAEANAGSCSSASQLGSVSVLAGSGSEPYELKGSVYLTGPYNGAPYGLLLSVPVEAGPFKLGNAITRLGISVEPISARVIVSGTLPPIVYGGIPVRLRRATVSITRQGFLSNPTNCQAEATNSIITGSLGATASLSSPFQVGNCAALAFKPAFGAATGARTSKPYGASLETTINVPAGDANIKSVIVQLPKQLPSRLTTLQKACPEATFAAGPYGCPTASWVGTVRASTPVLPNKLTGRAYLVSHGGAAFPDLDLILQADGVTVILVGNTNIKNGITTTTFANTPDVPVTSITLNLPTAENSALAAYGGFCGKPLIMPTTIVPQNGGAPFKQNTIIKVRECGVQIVGHKTIGDTAYLTVRTPEAGRISGSGANLATVYRHLGTAQKATTLKVPLSRGGRYRRKPLSIRLRVGFVPSKRGAANSASTVTVTFR